MARARSTVDFCVLPSITPLGNGDVLAKKTAPVVGLMSHYITGGKTHIERHIAALEYLVLTGTKNGVSGALRGISLDELGRTLLADREASVEDSSSHAVSD